MRLILALLAGMQLAPPLLAGTMVEENPQEVRIRAIASQLRCPVCQSENILDSQSGTAREMLDIVREQAAAGRSDAEIVTFFQTRYGDYVLLAPLTTGAGAMVWGVPLLLLLSGGGLGVALVIRLRRQGSMQGSPPKEPLTETRLQELEPKCFRLLPFALSCLLQPPRPCRCSCLRPTGRWGEGWKATIHWTGGNRKRTG